MASPAAIAPRLSCRACGASIDVAGRRIGDSVRCGACNALCVVLRSRTQGDVPPAIRTSGMSPEEQREVKDALRRIKLRRVGQQRANVELYPSWAVFVAGVQFYLAAYMAGQNLAALGDARRGRFVQVFGVVSYGVLGAALLAARVLLVGVVPAAILQPAWLVAALLVPLGFALYFWSITQPQTSVALEHGARPASLLLPFLMAVILGVAQAFAVYFLLLRIYGPYFLA